MFSRMIFFIVFGCLTCAGMNYHGKMYTDQGKVIDARTGIKIGTIEPNGFLILNMDYILSRRNAILQTVHLKNRVKSEDNSTIAQGK